MKLSRTVTYGLQATLQLAEADSDLPISCSRLAAQGSMPERFLLQILRNLVSHGILGSTRGAEGGYRLQRDLDEISLLDVIEAIDGPMTATMAPGEGLPADSKTLLDDALKSVTDVARHELEAVKLAHLIKGPRTDVQSESTTGQDANSGQIKTQ